MFGFQHDIKAKITAQRYIESCKTHAHIRTMERYVELYKQKFDDFLGHHTLCLNLESKNELITNKNK